MRRLLFSNVRKLRRSSVTTAGALIAVALLITTLPFVSNEKAFHSSELAFSDPNASGMLIVPASCPSYAHYAGECDTIVPNTRCSVIASDYDINLGESTTISWEGEGFNVLAPWYTYAYSMNVDPGEDMASIARSGNMVVTPQVTTRYILGVNRFQWGTYDRVSRCDAIVTVNRGPGCQITATPQNISGTMRTQITWSWQDQTNCVVRVYVPGNEGYGSPGSGSSGSVSYYPSGGPSGTYTAMLQCNNPVPHPPANTADSCITTINFNGDMCPNIANTQTSIPAGYGIDPSNNGCYRTCPNGSFAPRTAAQPLGDTAQCAIQCPVNYLQCSSDGQSLCSYTYSAAPQCSVTTTCTPCPNGCSGNACTQSSNMQASIQVAPQIVRPGETTRVTWSSINATSCTVSEDNPNITDSSTLRNGGFTSSAIRQRTIYTLRCLKSGSPDLVKTATVNILPTTCELGSPGCN